MRAQPVLEHGGRDVLAARGDDELLLAPGDAQEAVVVDLAAVAGVELAVDERLGGRGVVVPVAAEDYRAADEHLAVVGDADGRAGDGTADRADAQGRRGAERRRRRGLGEAVALVDRQADAAEEVAEPGAERGAAGEGVGHAAAEGRPQPAVDEPVEQRVLEPQREPGAALVQRLAPADGGAVGAVEQAAPPVAVGLLPRGVVDLLEHAGDRQQEGGREGRRGRRRGS